MNIKEELRVLSRRSTRLRAKNKKSKIKWPTDFQLRAVKLLEQGFSAQHLTKELNIPLQTFWHWRRLYKNTPKNNLHFIEMPVCDKLESSSVDKKEVIHLQTVKGTKLDVDIETFQKLIERGLL